ncbi:hypothetical protein GEMRC1_011644 [Eukaryota sp. GEM-RC1]
MHILAPFDDGKLRLSFLQVLKYVFIAPFLVPTRFVVTWTLVSMYFSIMQLYRIICLFLPTRIHPIFRNLILFPIFRSFSRVILFVNGYMWITRKGRKPRSSANYIIVTAPHQSWVDIYLLLSEFPPSFIAKAEVAKMPFVGSIAKNLNSIFVHREDPNARQKVAQELFNRRDHASDPNSLPLAIFPGRNDF